MSDIITKVSPREFLDAAPAALAANIAVVLIGVPGCISGDVFVKYEIRNKEGKRQNAKGGTMANLFNRFHKIGPKDYRHEKVADSEFYIQSVTDNGKVFLNKITNVIDSGIKTVYRVTTDKGNVIKTTIDHEFMTPSGRYSALANLSPGEQVMVNPRKVKKQGGRKRRPTRPELCVKFHPTAKVKVVNGCTYRRMQVHIAVYEAKMNGIEYKEYVRMLNAGPEEALAGFWTMPPGAEIHHKDEDPFNNHPDNLEFAESSSEHQRRFHLDSAIKRIAIYAEAQTIVAIEKVGDEHVYDVSVADPFRNFVAGEFVVHNCGKTDLAAKLAEQEKYSLHEGVPWCCCNPTDIVGLQGITKTKPFRSYYAPPEFLPTGADDDKILWLNDEFDKGDRDVQAAFLRLLLPDKHGVRKVGDYTMPRGVRAMLCGNRLEDRAGSQPLITPLFSRCVFFELVNNIDDWLPWAYENRLHASVISYLEHKKSDLCTFKPDDPPCPYACPRSWTRVSQLLRAGESLGSKQEHLEMGVAGLIGVGTAAGFNTFIRLRTEIPNIDRVFTHPESAELPNDKKVSVGYFTCACIAERCRDLTDVKLLNNVGIYAGRLRQNHGSMLMKHIFNCNRKLAVQAPSIMAWLARPENFDVLTSG